MKLSHALHRLRAGRIAVVVKMSPDTLLDLAGMIEEELGYRIYATQQPYRGFKYAGIKFEPLDAATSGIDGSGWAEAAFA